jgi:hypothetical protein
MVDCHRVIHDSGSGLYPSLKDMTNTTTGSGNIRSIHSKIDYTLASTILAGRIASCTIDHSPRHWGTTSRKNYHTALITSFNWDTLWASPADAPFLTQNKLKGQKLKAYPRYSNLNKVTGSLIAQRVSDDLHYRMTNLRGIWGGRKSAAIKRDESFRILKSVILKHAFDVLGKSIQTTRTQDKADADMQSNWDSLTDVVRRALGHTLHAYAGPRLSLDGPEIEAHRAYFTEQGVTLPTTPAEWRRWWACCDAHKTDAFSTSADMTITDKLALSDPKRFFQSGNNQTLLLLETGRPPNREGVGIL